MVVSAEVAAEKMARQENKNEVGRIIFVLFVYFYLSFKGNMSPWQRINKQPGHQNFFNVRIIAAFLSFAHRSTVLDQELIHSHQ